MVIQRIFVVAVAVLTTAFSSVHPHAFGTDVDAQDGIKQLEQLMSERNSIRSIRASGTVSQESGVRYLFDTQMSGENHRNDRQFLNFPANPQQVGPVDKVAIAGKEFRRQHSRFGAELLTEDMLAATQINARLLGLSPIPLEFFNHQLSADDMLVAQILAKAKQSDKPRFTNRTIRGENCHILTVERNAGEEMSAFFDQTMQYRGCEISSGAYYDTLWISEYSTDGTMMFPAKLHCRMTKDGEPVYDETAIIDEVEINPSISASVFGFAGLGVSNGDVVIVRNGALGDSPVIQAIFSNGELIPAVEQR